MDKVTLHVPFTKINKEKRIVTGVATTTFPDAEDDIIEINASLEAFADWTGNIREMHMPKAVGKKLDYRPITAVGDDGMVYDGIEVDVYISKGAEDTWQKILDGTLTGFSIGGSAISKSYEYNENLHKTFRVIKKFVMTELSVVDRPCNPLSMFTMIKSVDGETVMTEDFETHTLYYCKEHKFVKTDDDVCQYCGDKMANIGQTQIFDAANIDAAIQKYMKGDNMDLHDNEDHGNISIMDNDLEISDAQKEKLGKRLVKMLFGNDEEKEAGGVLLESAPQPVTINVFGGESSEIKKDIVTTQSFEDNTAESESDVVDEGNDSVDSEEDNSITKGGNDVSEDVTTTDETVVEDTDTATVDNGDDLLKGIGALLDSKLGEFKAEVDEKIDALSKSVDEVKSDAEASMEDVRNDLEKVANSGAGSKSEDVDVVDEDKIEKSDTSTSLWGGVFVPTAVVNALGYDS